MAPFSAFGITLSTIASNNSKTYTCTPTISSCTSMGTNQPSSPEEEAFYDAEEFDGNESDVEEDGADENGESDDDNEDNETTNEPYLPAPASGEQCSFDLRNLLAVNYHQVDSSMLYENRRPDEADDDITIPPDLLDVTISEKYLMEKAMDCSTQLIAALWQLPVERSDAGPLVTLPKFDASRVPRALVCDPNRVLPSCDKASPVLIQFFFVYIPTAVASSKERN